MTLRATRKSQPTEDLQDNSDFYVINHILRHIHIKYGTRYLVSWYEHTAAYDNVEPSNNVPELFIQSYWLHLNRQHRTKRKLQRNRT